MNYPRILPFDELTRILPFDELPPYPVRSFTYRNEQVRAYKVSRVIMYTFDPKSVFFGFKL
jgi:hypothetical protein